MATPADVRRWRREGRYDILRFVEPVLLNLWVDEDGIERYRCPFVRKMRGQNRYLCTIYETRPQVCRDYVPWHEGSICEVVE